MGRFGGLLVVVVVPLGFVHVVVVVYREGLRAGMGQVRRFPLWVS